MGYSDVSESLAEASAKVPTSQNSQNFQNFPFLDSAWFLSILRWILGLRHGSSLVFHRLHLVFHHRRLVFVAYRYRSPSSSPSRFHRISLLRYYRCCIARTTSPIAVHCLHYSTSICMRSRRSSILRGDLLS